MNEPLLLPQYAASLRETTIMVRITAIDQVSCELQHIASTIEAFVRHAWLPFDRVCDNLPKAYRRRPRHRSSRRLALQVSRARRGLDCYGKPMVKVSHEPHAWMNIAS